MSERPEIRKRSLTVLTVMMNERVRARYLVPLADDATTSEVGRSPTDADARGVHPRLRNAVTPSAQSANKHDMAHAGKRGQDVHQNSVKLRIGES